MIHVIITAANIATAYDKRKQQYIDSIESCLKYSSLFDSYTVLECVSPHEDYLDNYNTYYSKKENLTINKGAAELTHMLGYLEQSHLPDDACIIKLSGRYIIEDSYFFDKVIELNETFDSIFKSDNDAYVGNGYHTFLYYMKKKLFADLYHSVDFSAFDEAHFEWQVKNHIMPMERHLEIDRLGVLANQGTYSEKVYRC